MPFGPIARGDTPTRGEHTLIAGEPGLGKSQIAIAKAGRPYMGKIDSHKNAEVRGVLALLGELASGCNVAIASVTHFTKGTGNSSTEATNRIIGSVAFIVAPRIGFIVVADPDDQNRRLLLHVKTILAGPQRALHLGSNSTSWGRTRRVTSHRLLRRPGEHHCWKDGRRSFGLQWRQGADREGRCDRILEYGTRGRAQKGYRHRARGSRRWFNRQGPADRI